MDVAVKAAKKAFERGSEWRKLEPSARGELLTKVSLIKILMAEVVFSLELLESTKKVLKNVILIQEFFYCRFEDQFLINFCPNSL